MWGAPRTKIVLNIPSLSHSNSYGYFLQYNLYICGPVSWWPFMLPGNAVRVTSPVPETFWKRETPQKRFWKLGNISSHLETSYVVQETFLGHLKVFLQLKTYIWVEILKSLWVEILNLEFHMFVLGFEQSRKEERRLLIYLCVWLHR